MYIYLEDILKLEQTKKDVLFLLMKLSGLSQASDVKFKIESNDDAIKQINETINQNEIIFMMNCMNFFAPWRLLITKNKNK